MTSVLIKEKERYLRQREEDNMKIEAEEGCSQKPRNPRNTDIHQKLEE